VQAVVTGAAVHELLGIGVLTGHVELTVGCEVDVVGQEVHACRHALPPAALHADHGVTEEPVEVQPLAVARDRHAVVTGVVGARKRRITSTRPPLIDRAGVLSAAHLGLRLRILRIEGTGDDEALTRKRHYGIEPGAGREYRATDPGEPWLRAGRIDGEHLDGLAPAMIDSVQRVMTVAAGADREAVRDELRRGWSGAVAVELGIAIHRSERGLGDRVPALVRRIQQIEIARPRRRARQGATHATDENPLRAGNQHQILRVMRAADEVQVTDRRAALLARRSRRDREDGRQQADGGRDTQVAPHIGRHTAREMRQLSTAPRSAAIQADGLPVCPAMAYVSVTALIFAAYQSHRRTRRTRRTRRPRRKPARNDDEERMRRLH